MTDAGNWCLIESDPGVFTEMLHGFGVKGLQVEELYTLQDIDRTIMRPVYGLVFLFKWRPGDEPSGIPAVTSNVFFAQQVISNACATQALINTLMNINDPEVDIGPILKTYKEFAAEFDPPSRGLCLSNSEAIRNVHNSFARPTLYELDMKGGEKEDNFHFVTYIPLDNKVYELDGLREFPIEVADYKEGEDWLEAVKPVIQARMDKYSVGEIHFNLMAIGPNRKEKLSSMLENLVQANADNQLDDQIEELKRAISEEELKFELYHKENARRRHNYLPFLIELMKALAKEGKLVGLIEKAIKQAKERSGMLTERSVDLKRKQ